ncbi:MULTISPECIES: histidine phosphatase family protein [Paenibacillus]|uniref:Histidine phosphatase family protein n=1 Tax=Paenibacillus cucumis (ex Kampfer et al. 2016) TaxID=1776858 RepID=A0ABS7KDN1_9BACL|nr:histidine phosphatase family protein [Paenibacillus cucumis (ex Kampfer et al. 2016)]MBY0202254.1 histidine phosphatase family protein [Paenibacillus cucumis (ex Kampfer et al. 2016)]
MESIYLIRHAKAEGQEPYASLTDEGCSQAEKLADVLSGHGISYIVSSPWKRAVQTAMPLGAAIEQHIHTDERLQERVLSTRDLPDWMDVLKRTYEDEDWAAEGGESSRVAAARALALLKECWRRPERHGAVVTHGNLLSLIIRYYDPSFGYAGWAKLSNPDVYVLKREQESTSEEEYEEGKQPAISRLWLD